MTACLTALSVAAAVADNLPSSGAATAPPAAANGSSTDDSGSASPQPKQPSNGLIEDDDPAWVWSGMIPYTDPKLHGGTARVGGPGTYGTYTFHGTSVDVYGMTAPTIHIDKQDQLMGHMRVVIDGKEVGRTTVSSPDIEYGTLICHAGNLGPGNHVIEVHSDSGWIVLDYIKVTEDPYSTGYNGPSVIPAGDYAIYPRNATDKCVNADALTDHSQADIYTPAKGRNLIWHLAPLAKDRFRISPVGAPAEALTVLGPYKEQWGDVVGLVGVYKYVGDPAQQWILKPIDGPYFQVLVSAQIKAVLDVNDNATADGTMLIAYPNKNETDKGGYNEEFAFVPVKQQ